MQRKDSRQSQKASKSRGSPRKKSTKDDDADSEGGAIGGGKQSNYELRFLSAYDDDGGQSTNDDEGEEDSGVVVHEASSTKGAWVSAPGSVTSASRTMDTGNSRCELSSGGDWVCTPYKVELLEQHIQQSSAESRRMITIETLRHLGVKVFILDGSNIQSPKDLLKHIKRVVKMVSLDNSQEPWTGALGYQRCLLYQDIDGKLYNLVFAKHSVGPVSSWYENMEAFSVTEAIAAISILCRSFPCAIEDADVEGTFRPYYLGLILGLVLAEEIGLSALNVGMMIQASPSVSAHYLMSAAAPDLHRKLLVLLLSFAAVATGKTQRAITICGVGMACLVLLANLGARAWYFLQFSPSTYHGLGSSFVAYSWAVVTGLFVPYTGHRSVANGGKGAMEAVMRSSLIVAVCFVLSDYDEFQKFVVLGSENCNQDWVNFIFAVWWFVSTCCSLVTVYSLPHDEDELGGGGEQFLKEDHASPVGYKVPKLPDYEVDPSCMAQQAGLERCSMVVELVSGIAIASIVGGGIASFAFTPWEDNAFSNFKDAVAGAF